MKQRISLLKKGAALVLVLLATMVFLSCANQGTDADTPTFPQAEATAKPTAETTQAAETTAEPAEESTEVTTEETAEPTEESTEVTTEETAEPAQEPAEITDEPTESTAQPECRDYVINKNSGKFHIPDCASVKQMKESNKEYYTGTREDLISKGYDPCKNCKP